MIYDALNLFEAIEVLKQFSPEQVRGFKVFFVAFRGL